jgi:23S rRNA (adenine2503-C2)-methyltransferase
VSDAPAQRPQVHGFTPDGFVQAARELVPRGFGAARDLYKQAVREGRFEPASLGLSAEAVAHYHAAFRFELPSVASTVSEEGETGTTAKAVLRLEDGYEVECVLIPMGRDKHTLCVSSQVGCKMGCTFCETARMGLLRHLRADEIVAQLLVARHVLGWQFKNVVFMGMGEALDNPNLLHVLRLLNDSSGMQIAQECLTVCTVGSIDGIERLREAGMPRLNLSVSLNSADEATRSRIMPVNRKHGLAELQAALASYRPRPNFALGCELLPHARAERQPRGRRARGCVLRAHRPRPGERHPVQPGQRAAHAGAQRRRSGRVHRLAARRRAGRAPPRDQGPLRDGGLWSAGQRRAAPGHACVARHALSAGG